MVTRAGARSCGTGRRWSRMHPAQPVVHEVERDPVADELWSRFDATAPLPDPLALASLELSEIETLLGRARDDLLSVHISDIDSRRHQHLPPDALSPVSRPTLLDPESSYALPALP